MSSKKVKVLFAGGRKIFSYVIRFVTWSKFSHVGIVDDTGKYVYEAEAFMGVVKTPISDFIDRYKGNVTQVEFNLNDTESAFRYLDSQLGKSYDYSGIFGYIIRRDWQSDKSWFCSELLAKAFEQGGTPLFRKEYIARITPEDLWKINPDLRT